MELTETRHWTIRVLFFNILDASEINIMVLLSVSNPQWKKIRKINRKYFIKQLVIALTMFQLITCLFVNNLSGPKNILQDLSHEE